MANTFYEIKESAKISNTEETDSHLSRMSVTSFCGAESILEEEETRVCIQISIDSFGDNCLFFMTKSQAIQLAEVIKNVYRDDS